MRGCLPYPVLSGGIGHKMVLRRQMGQEELATFSHRAPSRHPNHYPKDSFWIGGRVKLRGDTKPWIVRWAGSGQSRWHLLLDQHGLSEYQQKGVPLLAPASSISLSKNHGQLGKRQQGWRRRVMPAISAHIKPSIALSIHCSWMMDTMLALRSAEMGFAYMDINMTAW